HSKVTGDSSAEKANEALELALAAGGPLTMLVSGARVSTVQAHCAGVGSTLPAASTALTVSVWGPSESGPKIAPLAQGTAAPPWSEQRKPPGSVELKVNGGEATLDCGAGPESIEVSGGMVSTTQLAVAGVGSTLPAGSVARTSKTWMPSARPA